MVEWKKEVMCMQVVWITMGVGDGGGMIIIEWYSASRVIVVWLTNNH